MAAMPQNVDIGRFSAAVAHYLGIDPNEAISYVMERKANGQFVATFQMADGTERTYQGAFL